jgi:hypothetical protein
LIILCYYGAQELVSQGVVFIAVVFLGVVSIIGTVLIKDVSKEGFGKFLGLLGALGSLSFIEDTEFERDALRALTAAALFAIMLVLYWVLDRLEAGSGDWWRGVHLLLIPPLVSGCACVVAKEGHRLIS